MPDHLLVGLQSYLKKNALQWPDPQVADLTAVSDGWESDVYTFNLNYGPVEARHRETLILRIFPGDDGRFKSAREYRGLQNLAEAGYPVPRVYQLVREDSPLDRPFILMERIAGRVLWPLLAETDEATRARLLTQFVRLLVRLHQLDWRPFVIGPPPDPAVSHRWVARELERWLSFAERFPKPGFQPLFAWLQAEMEQLPPEAPAPVHWDFHPANILLTDDGCAFVIDWTQIDVSDPRFDLAWTLLLVSTQGFPNWYEPILQQYQELRGRPVEGLAYFEAAACAKRLLSVVISLQDGPQKLGMRPEAVAAIKSSLGTMARVYELLLERTGIEVPEVEVILSE